MFITSRQLNIAVVTKSYKHTFTTHLAHCKQQKSGETTARTNHSLLTIWGEPDFGYKLQKASYPWEADWTHRNQSGGTISNPAFRLEMESLTKHSCHHLSLSSSTSPPSAPTSARRTNWSEVLLTNYLQFLEVPKMIPTLCTSRTCTASVVQNRRRPPVPCKRKIKYTAQCQQSPT